MVHGADIHDGRVGLWTDLIEGRTLEEILAAQGPMGPHEVVGIGAHLCQALAAVHREDLLHGDIKTSNVMRESGGRIVLMDFGASDRIPDPEGGPPLMVRGTPVAMAPEVLHGKPASQSSDIYSLGVLLYRLLTGEYPVEGEDFSTIVQAHDQRTQGSLRDARPDLPHDLVEIVETAIEPVPDRRFPSAGAMETALRSTMPPVAEPKERPQTAKPRSGSRLGHLTGIVAIGLLLLAFAFYLASRGREQTSEVSLETGESSIAVLPLESTGTDQD